MPLNTGFDPRAVLWSLSEPLAPGQPAAEANANVHPGVENGGVDHGDHRMGATHGAPGETTTSVLARQLDRTVPRSVSAKAKAIRQLLGDDDNDQAIMKILKACTPRDLAKVLGKVDVPELFHTVRHHESRDALGYAGNYDAELTQLVTQEQNLAMFDVGLKAAIIDGLQHGEHGDLLRVHQEGITKVFRSTQGQEVTDLKNAIDLGDDHYNMVHLVFRSIGDDDLRTELLRHFAAEAEKAGRQPGVKGLFDVDDTFYANLKDHSYPKGTAYPGTAAYHRALDLGPTGRGRLGDNNLLSARPHDHLGQVEVATLKTVHARGEGPIAVITGDLLHFVGDENLAAGKLKNFDRYDAIYPEFLKVFEGDSGQGDVLVAVTMLREHREQMAGASIHELPGHPTDPALKREAEALGVFFYETRIGQAVHAYEQGLIAQEALARIQAAAFAEFDRVDFKGDEATRNARKAELERDSALVDRILAAV